jgi:hypothetical protein
MGPASVYRGRCVAYDVQLQDSGGAPAPALADLTLALEGAGAQGAFYSDAACTAAISSISLPTGQSGARAAGIDLHYKSTIAASLSFAVTGTTNGLAVVSPSLAVSADLPPATQLHWAGASAVTTVGCAALSVLVQDQFGDPFVATAPISVDLTDGVAPGDFYSDAACASAVSSVTVAPGQSGAAVYYHQSSTGAATLHAASAYAGPLSASDTLLSVTAAPPSQLSISGSSTMTARFMNSLLSEKPGPEVVVAASAPPKEAPMAAPIAAISSSAWKVSTPKCFRRLSSCKMSVAGVMG